MYSTSANIHKGIRQIIDKWTRNIVKYKIDIHNELWKSKNIKNVVKRLRKEGIPI